MAPIPQRQEQQELLMDIKDRIQAAMAWRGIDSQADLVRALNKLERNSYSRQTINNWLQGKVANMSHAALFDLADVLEVNARWLAVGSPYSPAKPIWPTPDEQKVTSLASALEKADPEYYARWIENGQWELDRQNGATRQNPYPLRQKTK